MTPVILFTFILIAIGISSAYLYTNYGKFCPAGQIYDNNLKECRIKCLPGEIFDPISNTCVKS